jgi:tetratricopeptide (TPR) repeat protein
VIRAAWLILALAMPAVAQETEDETESAEEVPTDVFDGLSDKINRGDWKGAAEQANGILADSTMASAHPAAWGYLGAALHKGNLPYAALAAWGEGLRDAPIALTPHYPNILSTTDALSEDIWVGGLIGQDMGVPFSPDVKDHVALLAARWHFSQQSWGTALAMTTLVGDASKWGLEASVLRGVVLAQQSRYGEALASLLPARERAIRGNRDDHYVAALSLNIARTFYASGNFGRAMEYYNKVSRADDYWPQAHFERAWAHFAVQDMPGALALLHTHNSPFFEDWYFPEADLVRAQALFLMCKFPESTKTIDGFNDKYQPLHDSLAGTIGSMDAAAAFQDGRDFLAGKSTQLPLPLLRKLQWDRRFQDAAEAIDRADAELQQLEAQSGAWATRSKKALMGRRDVRVKAEGARLLDMARDARDELDDMLEGIELTRVDLLTLEADLYERAAATGEEIEYAEKVDRLRKLRKKGKRVWPFDGEYWADELGWYRIDAQPDCPKNLQRAQ